MHPDQISHKVLSSPSREKERERETKEQATDKISFFPFFLLLLLYRARVCVILAPRRRPWRHNAIHHSTPLTFDASPDANWLTQCLDGLSAPRASWVRGGGGWGAQVVVVVPFVMGVWSARSYWSQLVLQGRACKRGDNHDDDDEDDDDDSSKRARRWEMRGEGNYWMSASTWACDVKRVCQRDDAMRRRKTCRSETICKLHLPFSFPFCLKVASMLIEKRGRGGGL